EPRRSEAKTGYLRGQLTLDDIDLPTGRRASPPRFGSRLRPQYSCPADKPAHRVLTVQSFSSADGVSASQRATSRPTRLILGVAVMALVILLAVVGASAEHGTGAPQLRRGPASVVLSVLFTLAGLAGVGSLALLFWGLVTRNRRSLDGSGPQRPPPRLVPG